MAQVGGESFAVPESPGVVPGLDLVGDEQDWEELFAEAERQAERDAIPTDVDFIGPFQKGLFTHIALAARNRQGAEAVAAAAMDRVTPDELREQQKDEAQQEQAPTTQEWATDTLQRYVLLDPETGEPGTPESKDLHGADTLDDIAGTFQRMQEMVRSAPKPPEMAELEDPTALSLIVAGIFALARPDKAADIMALPYLHQLQKQATETEQAQVEFAAIDSQHDDELRLLEIELGREDQEERFKIEDKRADDELELARDRLAFLETQEEGRLTRNQRDNQRRFIGMAADLLTSGIQNPEGLEQWFKDINRNEGFELFDESNLAQYSEAAAARQKLNEDEQKADTALTLSKVPTEEARAEKLRLDNEKASATMQDAIAKFHNEFLASGIKIDLLGKDLEKATFVVAHLEEVHQATMASVIMRTKHLGALIAKLETDGLSENEKERAKREINKQDSDIKALQSAVNALQSDVDDVTDKYLATKDIKGEDDPGTKSWFSELNRKMRALGELKDQLIAARREADDLFNRLHPVDDTRPFDPSGATLEIDKSALGGR